MQRFSTADTPFVPMQKLWRYKAVQPAARDALAGALGLSPITAQLLLNRGITDPAGASTFLRSDLCDLIPAAALTDLPKACARLATARARAERIMVYGDYDVDGITATAMMFDALKRLGARVSWYIPHRMEEGYGLSREGIEEAVRREVTLILTVDCGSTAADEIAHAAARGIDVIVTDHHQLPDGLPPAYAVVNPHRTECPYPFKGLSGVGVAYKLLSMLLENESFLAEEYLDLVALGTIADVVPQTGENRIFIRHGLSLLSARPRTGIKALIEVAGLSQKEIAAWHVSFILAPRINAIGRVGAADEALHLLLSTDPDEARRLALRLDQENRSRQDLEGEILQQALRRVSEEIDFSRDRVIVLAQEGWHRGVIGIVASRLVDRFNRPSILIGIEDGIGRGSGRSVEGFHLFDALKAHAGLLTGFGGHKAACGVTIAQKNIETFRRQMNAFAVSVMTPEALLPKIDVDMLIPLAVLTEELITEIYLLAPFGLGNPKPVFAAEGLRMKTKPVRLKRSGVKFWASGEGKICEVVAFGKDEELIDSYQNKTFSLAFSPALSHYQGITSIKLNYEDIK